MIQQLQFGLFALTVAILGAYPQLTAAQSPEVAIQYRPMEGQPHPDFLLPTISGKSQMKLSDYRGKKVLLLHFASW